MTRRTDFVTAAPWAAVLFCAWYRARMAIHETYAGPMFQMSAMTGPKVIAIAAIGTNRVLGKDNELLWRIPDDMKRLREVTLGHPLVMGRKTFDSIIAAVGKPLPNRQHIVVTRDSRWSHDGAIVAYSIEDAITRAKALDQHKVFIFGGAQIYTAAMPYTDMLMLTIIDDAKEGDAYFPAFDEFSNVLFREDREHEGLKYSWVDLTR